MNPQPPRGGQIVQHTALTADHAQETAMKAAPNAEPVALFLPVQQRGEPGLSWRVQMTARGDPFNVMVDNQSGQVTVVSSQPATAPRAGSGGFMKAVTVDRCGAQSSF